MSTTQENSLVLLKLDKHIATITLNMPPANVLSIKMIENLRQIFQRLEHTDTAVVILTGQGDHSFSAGANIKELVQNDVEANKLYFNRIYDTFNLISSCRFPVIAAVNGYAYGAGLELALCADIRVMDEKAHMSATGVNLNLVFCTQRLVRLLGPGKAKDMLLCARKVNALQALEWGLVQYMSPSGSSLDKAEEIASLIAGKGQPAVQGVKQIINQGLDLPLNEALQLEARQIFEMFATPEFRERTRGFLNR